MADATQDRTQAAFAVLEAAIPSSDLSFEVDLKRLCHPNCPLPFDHLKSRIAYGYLVLFAVILGGLVAFGFEQKIIWGTIAVVTLAYWIGLRPILERRAAKRIVAYIMEEPSRLERVWKYGGIVLVKKDGGRAVAPKDDWRSAVIGPKS